MQNFPKSGIRNGRFWSFMITQFLGAFNDNVFKFLLIGFGMAVLSESEARSFVPLASLVFVLPFWVFSSISGSLADRFSKGRIVIWTKVLEIVVMLAGAALFHYGMVYGLLAVLFFMGGQSTLFSPAKYGILPETLHEKSLSLGNGLLQLFTFVSVLLGGCIGSMMSEKFHDRIYLGAWFCVAVAVAGTLSSLFVAQPPVANPGTRLVLDPVRPHFRILRDLFNTPVLKLSILGNTFFWFLATVLQTNVAIIVKQDLKLGDSAMGWVQAALAVGIGLGSALAGYLSHGKVAFNFVLPGGVIMAILMIVGGFAMPTLPAVLAVLSIVGIAAGFYQIPLGTGIQRFSPAEKIGSVLAATNVLDCISMILGSAAHWILLGPLGCSGRTVVMAMGIITLAFLPFLYRQYKKIGNYILEFP